MIALPRGRKPVARAGIRPDRCQVAFYFQKREGLVSTALTPARVFLRLAKMRTCTAAREEVENHRRVIGFAEAIRANLSCLLYYLDQVRRHSSSAAETRDDGHDPPDRPQLHRRRPPDGMRRHRLH